MSRPIHKSYVSEKLHHSWRKEKQVAAQSQSGVSPPPLNVPMLKGIHQKEIHVTKTTAFSLFYTIELVLLKHFKIFLNYEIQSVLKITSVITPRFLS